MVGAPSHPFDPLGPGAPGAVFVYHRQGASWQLAAELSAPAGDANPNDRFGAAVSMQGDLIAVGAHGDDQMYENAGAVYLYRRVGSTWNIEAKLLPFNTLAFDLGIAVSVWDDTVLAGSRTLTTGNAFAYRKDGSTWTNEAHLLPANASAKAFGNAVGLYQDTAVIGAPSTTLQYNADGAAYIFRRTGATWTQQVELANPTPLAFEQYGTSVAVQGRWAFVGTPYDNTAAHNTGAVYVYRQDPAGAWSHSQSLFPSDGFLGGHLFGWSCAMADGKTVVGAPQAGVVFEGAAYQFNVAGVTWSEVSKYTASDPDGSDWFGFTVGAGSYALVGAYLDDGIGFDAGAAYVRELCP